MFVYIQSFPPHTLPENLTRCICFRGLMEPIFVMFALKLGCQQFVQNVTMSSMKIS